MRLKKLSLLLALTLLVSVSALPVTAHAADDGAGCADVAHDAGVALLAHELFGDVVALLHRAQLCVAAYILQEAIALLGRLKLQKSGIQAGFSGRMVLCHIQFLPGHSMMLDPQTGTSIHYFSVVQMSRKCNGLCRKFTTSAQRSARCARCRPHSRQGRGSGSPGP